MGVPWMSDLRRRVVAFALVVGVAFAAGLAGAPARAQTPGARPKLLMLPIVVHSSEDPEYLRNGLADMLASRFTRLAIVQLLRAESGQSGTSDLDRARAQARKVGADYVLFGSFTRFGQGASLDVQCAATDERTGREPLREIFVHSGSIGDIIPDLDELAGKVSRFARGEAVTPGALRAGGALSPGGLGSGAAATAAQAEELERLRSRVEALEDTIEVLLEQRGEAGEGA